MVHGHHRGHLPSYRSEGFTSGSCLHRPGTGRWRRHGRPCRIRWAQAPRAFPRDDPHLLNQVASLILAAPARRFSDLVVNGASGRGTPMTGATLAAELGTTDSRRLDLGKLR